MKLKGLNLCILGLIGGLILLPSFSNAVDQNFYPDLPATLQDGQDNDLELKPGVNFLFNDTYKVISVYGGGPYPRLKNVFWNNTGLYFIRSCAGGYDCTSLNTSIELQGFVDGFLECAISDSPCSDGFKGISEFTSNSGYSNPDYLHLIDNQWNNTTLSLCFVYQSQNKQACFNLDQLGLSNSLGFTYNPLPSQLGQSEDQISRYFTISPLNSSIPTQYYYSTGSCPSVGQLKATSNLTPAVCYGGYGPNVIYGDQVAFVGGSGMSIFDVYNDYLTSFSDHSMDIQTFYDTYWAYYQNISHDSRPFEGLKKAYLGLQFARQTFGNTRGVNGSYMILNYCYYVVNNISDNQSTCVGTNVSTQYTGITFTDQDKQDIVDAVNDNYIVHSPGSGSIFLDPSQGLGGGGSSWGDEECRGIPCLFEKFYQMFTSSRINDVDFSQGGQGILPSYIALAFVIVVLFYVFKR